MNVCVHFDFYIHDTYMSCVIVHFMYMCTTSTFIYIMSCLMYVCMFLKKISLLSQIVCVYTVSVYHTHVHSTCDHYSTTLNTPRNYANSRGFDQVVTPVEALW
jgi:hypothetical protein